MHCCYIDLLSLLSELKLCSEYAQKLPSPPQRRPVPRGPAVPLGPGDGGLHQDTRGSAGQPEDPVPVVREMLRVCDSSSVRKTPLFSFLRRRVCFK